MKRRRQVTLLMSVLVLSTNAAVTRNTYTKYVGHKVDGHILTTLMSASLIRCSSACEGKRPDCRGFNFHKADKNCQILKSFWDLDEDSDYDLYYDRDMYQELSYVKQSQSLRFHPDPSAPAISWWKYDDMCELVWGKLFIPQDATDWSWMQQVASSYQGMWTSFREDKENEGTYRWPDWSQAPGSLSFTIKEDTMNEVSTGWHSDGYRLYENYVDCGLMPGTLMVIPEDVIIKDCSSSYPGYICKAGIPDPEAVEIHP